MFTNIRGLGSKMGDLEALGGLGPGTGGID